ncbi:hypothetical protein [Vibrio hangzhouensis]|uniref:Outer membrane protein beta-barrel domain-containing protein n=1 Tax=Vibrio hangzhouensis TaxID=462991 RepID=A0A1H5V5Z6_9VIBR|nr:hypothetical protein [Vibrio hangzhouensis]SEF82624.1 hypothetical protein SAMN04488244_10462 [Vibrio hangzhouensis]
MFRIVAMLFGLSVVFSGFAMADEENTESDSWKGNVDVTFAGWTEHLTSTGRNQDNYIVGFRYRQFEAFTLINSFDSRSYILAFHPQYEWKSWAKVGLRLGGISGYTQDENKIQAGGITPVVAPTLTLHYQHLGFETALFTDVLVFSLKVMI